MRRQAAIGPICRDGSDEGRDSSGRAVRCCLARSGALVKAPRGGTAASTAKGAYRLPAPASFSADAFCPAPSASRRPSADVCSPRPTGLGCGRWLRSVGTFRTVLHAVGYPRREMTAETSLITPRRGSTPEFGHEVGRGVPTSLDAAPGPALLHRLLVHIPACLFQCSKSLPRRSFPSP